MPDSVEDARPDEAADQPTPADTTDAGPTRRRRRVAGVLAVLGERRVMVAAAIVVVALVGGGAWWMSRGLPESVAARVGETEISTSEVRQRMTALEALYGVQVPSEAEKREDFWRDATQSIVMAQVIADVADKEGVSVNKGEVDRSLETFVSSVFGKGEQGWSGFTKALGNVGTSEGEVREEIRRQLELNALFARVTDDVAAPTNDEVESAYAERRCSLQVAQGRRISNIVVPTKGEAQRVLQRLRSGTSFATLAAESSIDGSTRDKGGDLGVVRADELTDGYGKAAFGARRGETFGPVRSDHGWNVGLVTGVEPAHVPALNEVREDLRMTLFTEAQSKVWRSWLRDRIEGADVKYNDDYRPDDPLALPNDALPEGATGDADVDKDC